MNLPNKFTVLRLILVIPFVVCLIAAMTISKQFDINGSSNEKNKVILFLVSGLIFAFAMFTDFLDGYYARKLGQETTFGKLFDPLADKFMTTSALICFSVLGIIPVYVTIIIVLRDLLVDGSRNIAAKNNVSVAAGYVGKTKTLLLSFSIVSIFLIVPFIKGNVSDIFDPVNPDWKVWALISPILVATILSTISGITYFKAIKKYINIK